MIAGLTDRSVGNRKERIMFSKYSVKKPLTVLVAIIIIAILGGVSYTNMTVDLLPSMHRP